MPAVLRVGKFRFFFFSNESQEPPHIHVRAADKECKFWLEPVSLEINYGFNARELSTIEELIDLYHDDLLEAWNDYFAT
jgi:hypothetical protein